MKATNVKDWKSLNDYVYGKVSGNDKAPLTDDECETLRKNALEIFKHAKLEELRDDVDALTEINILDKNVDFSIFDKVKDIWTIYYGVALEINN